MNLYNSANIFLSIGYPFQSFLIGLLLFSCGTSCLRINKITVPSKVIVGDSVWLNCSYDLEDDQLYSIKWYKDDEEIYRFLPSSDTPSSKYETFGFYLDLPKSSYGNLLLTVTEIRGQGDYGCEVSADAPSFQTVKETRRMQVVNISTPPPRIERKTTPIPQNSHPPVNMFQANSAQISHQLQFHHYHYLLTILMVYFYDFF